MKEDDKKKNIFADVELQGAVRGIGTTKELEIQDQLIKDVKAQSARVSETGENVKEFGEPFTFFERFEYKSLRQIKDTSPIYNHYRDLEEKKVVDDLPFFLNYILKFTDDVTRERVQESNRKLQEIFNGDPENAITKKQIEESPELQFEGWQNSFKPEQNLNIEMWMKRKNIIEERRLASRIADKENTWQHIADFAGAIPLDLVFNAPFYMATGFGGFFSARTIARAAMIYGLENVIQGEIAFPIQVARSRYEGDIDPQRTMLDRMFEFGLGGFIAGSARAISIKKNGITNTKISDGLTDSLNARAQISKAFNMEGSNEADFNLKSNQYIDADGDIIDLPTQFEFQGIKDKVDVDYTIVSLDDILNRTNGRTETIQNIINDFRPEDMIFKDSFQEGAIVIDKDFNVISGNSRLKALEVLSILEPEKFKAYQDLIASTFPRKDLNVQSAILVKQIARDLEPDILEKLKTTNSKPTEVNSLKNQIAESINEIDYDAKVEEVLLESTQKMDINNPEIIENIFTDYPPEIKEQVKQKIDIIKQLKDFTNCIFGK